MPTLVCVPIMVESIDASLKDAALAKIKGADLVELRIDPYFHGSTGSDAEDQVVINELHRLLAECPLPVVLTCRSSAEGGDYDGEETDRVSMLEKLTAACDTPPAYLDFELAAYQKSANIRQKINLCVAHPEQKRDVATRLILSMHDFEKRPADLDRRLLAAYDEPACSVVKVAYRARSIRDNLDLFELTRGAPKPTIALGMGEFGLMSRVLAPKFNGYLTFAALRDESTTAPGQPTLSDLFDLYRFRSINPKTLVYGIVGWPVTHSLSPLVHNAGFEAVGHDGEYLPMPIPADPGDPEGSDANFKATFEAMRASPIDLAGASITLPHKGRLAAMADAGGDVDRAGAANTFARGKPIANTDLLAIRSLVSERLGSRDRAISVAVIGAGGVARAAVAACPDATVFNRTRDRAAQLAADFEHAKVGEADRLGHEPFGLYINCTPVGMAGGPDPEGLSIPIDKLPSLPPETVFFDTVYNPVETPMLRAARAAGYTTIDGVQMFVKQAAHQFTLWTGKPAPERLFDRLCRERLGGAGDPA